MMAIVTNWPLHVHYGITLWTYLSQTHRPTALHCMHYGITPWAYLSKPLVKDSHKHPSLTEKPQYRMLKPHYCYICVTERHTETYEENGWLSRWLSRSKFIMLLTFELSSFRENDLLVYCISHAVAADTSRWTPKSVRGQNRENRHTDTQDNYCNPHACVPRVN